MRGRHGDHVPSAYSVNLLSSNASQRISNGLPEDNLRLLAYQCSNATPMNKNSASNVASSIPIATPVPLPYTARSSTVLYSMISGSKGTKNIQHPLTLVEQLEESRQEMETCHPIPIERDNPSHASIYLLNPQQHNVTTSHRGSGTHTFRPIRPISPSTLIALTEPFLMAWCMRLPTPSRPALPPLSTIPPTPTLHAPSRIDLAHSAVHMQTQNAWGY